MSIYKTHPDFDKLILKTYNLMQELNIIDLYQSLYEEAIKYNKIHTYCRSESSKLKLGHNRQTKETMLKTLRFKKFARFEFE